VATRTLRRAKGPFRPVSDVHLAGGRDAWPLTAQCLLPASSVNHRAPSGPTVIPEGPLGAVGTGYSGITPL
jgi:hypothetical protein